jgi:hypothetical protein
LPRSASWSACRLSVTWSAQHRQRQQLLGLGGRGRQRGVLLGGQGAETVPGLGGDDDPGAAAGEEVPELLEQHGGAVQVHGQDHRRRRLAG